MIGSERFRRPLGVVAVAGQMAAGDRVGDYAVSSAGAYGRLNGTSAVIDRPRGVGGAAATGAP